MDSVFAGSAEDDLEFDTIFDQEDSLIDTVCGCNEAGDPLTGVEFDELHQTDDNATPDDIRDDLEGEDVKNGAPNPEGTKEEKPDDVSVKGEVGKDSDADKFYGDEDENYQKDKSDPKPDENDLEKTIDKATESVEEPEDGEDIDSILDSDDEPASECTGEPGCKCEKCSSLREGDEPTDPTPEEPELNKDDQNQVKEASNGIDSDVANVISDEENPENDDIDKILDGDDDNSGASDLKYDLSDEDLIDIAMNGNI
jgi:hypothetical protein